MAKTDEITVQGYEAPDQVDIKVKEEVPSPPGGASRWAEFTEDKPQWGNASWWGNVGERAKAVLPYLKDNAKAYGALATDVWAKDILPNAVGKVYGGLTGVDSEDDYEDYDVDESRMPPLGPHYRPQTLDDYMVRRRDVKPSTEDVMSGRASVGGRMDYLDPSNEYPGMLEAGALADVDASEAEVGRGGRFLGNLLNRLQGDFETSDKEDEDAYREALAAGQGALGYLSDTLPDQLEALAGEGGTRLGMAALGPAYIKAKEAIKDRDKLIEKLYKKGNPHRYANIAYSEKGVPYDEWGDYDVMGDVLDDANETKRIKPRSLIDAQKRVDSAWDDLHEREANLNVARRFARRGEVPLAEAKKSLPTEAYTDYAEKAGGNIRDAHLKAQDIDGTQLSYLEPEERVKALRDALALQEKASPEGHRQALNRAVDDFRRRRYLSPEDRTATLKSMARNFRRGDPKPLLNPAIQSANSIADNVAPVVRNTISKLPHPDGSVEQGVARGLDTIIRQKPVFAKAFASLPDEYKAQTVRGMIDGWKRGEYSSLWDAARDRTATWLDDDALELFNFPDFE